MAYLVARGYSAKMVKSKFDDIREIERNQSRQKVKRLNQQQKIIFSTNYNPRGPDISYILKRHMHLLQNTPSLNKLFPSGSIVIANRRCKNLKELLVRGDPYCIKKDLMDNSPHGYKPCGKKCDSCNNFVTSEHSITSNATGRKFSIRRDSTCTTPNVVYMAYCLKCNKQGVGSTVSWKPRLSNYKSHIKKKVHSCRIVSHFIDECFDNDVPFKNLAFIIIDVVENTNGLTHDEIEDLLLQKEKFWNGTLVTQHQGLNSTHDWRRTKRTEREK